MARVLRATVAHVTLKQLTLIEDVGEETVASPLCCYDNCQRKGRAVMGPPRDLGDCINRSIRCLKCGATGEESAAAPHVIAGWKKKVKKA